MTDCKPEVGLSDEDWETPIDSKEDEDEVDLKVLDVMVRSSKKGNQRVIGSRESGIEKEGKLLWYQERIESKTKISGNTLLNNEKEWRAFIFIITGTRKNKYSLLHKKLH